MNEMVMLRRRRRSRQDSSRAPAATAGHPARSNRTAKLAATVTGGGRAPGRGCEDRSLDSALRSGAGCGEDSFDHELSVDHWVRGRVEECLKPPCNAQTKSADASTCYFTDLGRDELTHLRLETEEAMTNRIEGEMFLEDRTADPRGLAFLMPRMVTAGDMRTFHDVWAPAEADADIYEYGGLRLWGWLRHADGTQSIIHFYRAENLEPVLCRDPDETGLLIWLAESLVGAEVEALMEWLAVHHPEIKDLRVYDIDPGVWSKDIYPANRVPGGCTTYDFLREDSYHLATRIKAVVLDHEAEQQYHPWIIPEFVPRADSFRYNASLRIRMDQEMRWTHFRPDGWLQSD